MLAEMTLRSRTSTAAGFTPMRLLFVVAAPMAPFPMTMPLLLPGPAAVPARFVPMKFPTMTLFDDPCILMAPGKTGAFWRQSPRIVLPELPGRRSRMTEPPVAVHRDDGRVGRRTRPERCCR